jgi:hypothetical protein
MFEFDFTNIEAREIFEIGISNDQIYSIGTDEDISSFFNKLMKDYPFDVVDKIQGGLFDTLFGYFASKIEQVE